MGPRAEDVGDRIVLGKNRPRMIRTGGAHENGGGRVVAAHYDGGRLEVGLGRATRTDLTSIHGAIAAAAVDGGGAG